MNILMFFSQLIKIKFEISIDDRICKTETFIPPVETEHIWFDLLFRLLLVLQISSAPDQKLPAPSAVTHRVEGIGEPGLGGPPAPRIGEILEKVLVQHIQTPFLHLGSASHKDLLLGSLLAGYL